MLFTVMAAYIYHFCMTAEIDTGAMMMKNTRWMRGFWGEAQDVFRDVEQMDEVRGVPPASPPRLLAEDGRQALDPRDA